MKTFYIFITLNFVAIALTNNTQASTDVPKRWTNATCPIAQTHDTNNQLVYFFQHVFDDGTQDLVIAKSGNGEDIDVKRVTYSGEKTPVCHYKVLAIARGGEGKQSWGWHLVWANANNVYYARMDGEAWVSSVPKRFEFSHITSLKITQNLLQLEIQLEDVDHLKHAILSEDEGRTWEIK